MIVMINYDLMPNNYLYSEVTSKIINCFFKVYNKLGFGFLEKVYQNSLLIELSKAGLKCVPNYPVDVYYYDQQVGLYLADIIINDCVVIENKAMESLCPEHEAQLVNYLKATDIEVGILLNFGKTAQFKRKVFS
jgi:GxxExxY protein